jgi:uncharacterized protein DUF4190
MAVSSLVAGIASLVCCGLLAGIPAIILGFLSRGRISRSSGMLGGGGMATAGVILGFVGSSVWMFIAGFGVYTYLQIGHRPPTRSAIPCDLLEHTVVHYHAAVQIFEGGVQVPIPTNVGRPGICFYWIHMHAGSPDVVHIEAPDERAFTVGDFFDVWAASTKQPVRLDSRHVGTIALGTGQTLVVFVDGNRYSADPAGIVLLPHTVVQLEIAPPTLDPPPAFAFQSGL